MRNLDGVYFRIQRDGKWLNICFTDLTGEEAREVLVGRSEEWKLNLYKILEESLNEITDIINNQLVDEAMEIILKTKDEAPLDERLIELKNVIGNLGEYYDIVGINN